MLTEKFIILKRIKYGESDLIVHALSKKGARQNFLARGALKSKKRFGGGVLEPSHYVELTYKPSLREDALHQLLEAKIINDFSGIRKSYEHLEVAFQLLEAVAKVSQEGDQRSEDLFNLLGNSLTALPDVTDLAGFKVHFGLKFLMQQGVLDPSDWMNPFLKTPLRSQVVVPLSEEWSGAVESLLKRYLSTAQVQ